MVLTPNRFSMALTIGFSVGLLMIFIWAATQPRRVRRARFNLKMMFAFVALAAGVTVIGSFLAPLVRRNSEIHSAISEHVLEQEEARRASVRAWHQGGPLPHE